jgi:hypothetical protein
VALNHTGTILSTLLKPGGNSINRQSSTQSLDSVEMVLEGPCLCLLLTTVEAVLVLTLEVASLTVHFGTLM